MRIIFIVFAFFFSFCESQAVIIRDGFDLDKSEKWGKRFKPVCFVGASFEDGAGHKSNGVLIAPGCVLTTAHSVRSGQGSKLTYVIFSDNIAEGDGLVVSEVSEIIPHPDHGMDDQFFCHGVDLAILKLEIPVESIAPVKLYNAQVKPNEQFYIASFGPGGTSTTGITKPSGKRHMGTTRVTGVEERYLSYDYTSATVVEGQLPIRFDVSADMDPLQSILVEGDSGSPLLKGKFDSPEVAGIFHGISGVSLAGQSFMTEKWIPVAPYKDWILENL